MSIIDNRRLGRMIVCNRSDVWDVQVFIGKEQTTQKYGLQQADYNEKKIDTPFSVHFASYDGFSGGPLYRRGLFR